MSADTSSLLTVDETGRRLGVSVSTVWRLIRRGALRSVRQGGRRLVPENALRTQRKVGDDGVPAFTHDHPIFRLAGAGRSGGSPPGASDKHGILDR